MDVEILKLREEEALPRRAERKVDGRPTAEEEWAGYSALQVSLLSFLAHRPHAILGASRSEALLPAMRRKDTSGKLG